MGTTSTPPPRSHFRALLLEGIHPSAHAALESAGCVVEALPKALPEPELIARIQGVHVLGIRSKTHVSPAVLASAPELLAVGCFCIGTNQVALDRAHDRAVPVFNAPFSNTRSVAEMIIAEVIFLARQLGDRVREMHAGRWKKVASRCHEVRGRTLGIVGYGHIGRQVGVLAEAVGLRVLFYDTGTRLPMGNNTPVASLDELLARSEFVTLHVPGTPQTHRMITAQLLSRMRPGAYLLNASRGTVVDLDALAEALRSGHLAGAAVDVYPDEPEANGEGFATPLKDLPNVLLTPHVGGSTEEAQEAIGREVAASLRGFLVQGTTAGSVNFPQLELAPSRGTHRVLNVHRNVPGVLRDVNRIVSERNGNVHAQLLSTDAELGYLIMDLDQDVTDSVAEAMAALSTDLRTRVCY
ncbi:MAG: phosphoglycerate dehydrogenase [Deltaproteobacteria bacterium]|nr:phosphoglycerate dehydrogenase [Deltaproteobacteria bacterium]